MRNLKLGALLLALPLITGAGDTSWNWYGGETIKGETKWNFFELNGLKHLPDGHIQVWVKTLNQKDVDATKPGQAAIDQAANRLRNNYVPIVARGSGKYTKDQLVNMIIYEAIANDGVVNAPVQVLFEIDCKGDMDRLLSIHIDDGNTHTSTDNAGSWEHIVPDTNASRLKSAVC